jgi:carboxymethylenebutenolidase
MVVEPAEIPDMIVTAETVDLATSATTVMRCLLAAPTATGRYPGLVCYSDIFQLTGPMRRACVRLAGYGFIVLAPEIYGRIEVPGTVISFDDAGRTRGLDDAARSPVAHFDADCRLALDHLARHPSVELGQVGAAGFCIGGHLAFRAALQPEVKATVCFYPTGVHNGKLGRDDDAGSLQRVAEIKGRLLLVWGEHDPHIPAAGRATIEGALHACGVRFEHRIYPADHAFMRDEGPRYDPEASDAAFLASTQFLRAALAQG